jgi:hypothetical protein
VSLGLPLDQHVVAEPGDRLVFGGSADPSRNGGIEGVFEVPDLYMERQDTLSLVVGEVVLLEQDLDLLPARIGASAALVDGVWCLETASYGDQGNLGSPGEPNSACAAPPVEEPEQEDPTTELPPQEKEGCGCQTGGSGMGLWLGALLLVRRRR